MDRREVRPMAEVCERSFAERLLEVWKKMHPEVVNVSVEQQEQMRNQVEQRENVIRDQEVLEVLNEYGIDTSKIIEDADGNYRITVNNHFSQKRLPAGYGYKGGAARSLLLRSLGIDPAYQPRDVDLIRFSEEEPEPGMDDYLAQEYSPEDFSAVIEGQGRDSVEKMKDVDRYLQTRDFTLNELYATDDEVVATRECLLDSVRRIIHLTEYEYNMFPDRIGSKMLAKAVFLYAEAIERWGEAEITHDLAYEYQFVPPFYLAVHLDKAFERGPEVAKRYVQELMKREQLPDDIITPEDAADYLLSLIRDKNFYYRHAPIGQFEIEEEWMEQYDQQPRFRGHGRSRGEK
ncbi:MAG: hypothetical protein ABIH67_04720 [Candidatus Uhrbacteria bacterium]